MPSAVNIRNFLLVFASLCGLATILVLLDEFGGYGWADKMVAVGHSMGRLFITATGITYVLVEGKDMLAELYKRARYEEGKQEGQQLERAAWTAWRERLESWERRREVAQATGSTFNEPRPAPPA